MRAATQIEEAFNEENNESRIEVDQSLLKEADPEESVIIQDKALILDEL